MKQPGAIVTLLVFIVAVSFVLAAQQRQDAQPLVASLSGKNQLAGDADGSGTARIILNATNSQLCYEVAVSNIATPEKIVISNSKSKIVSFGLGSEAGKCTTLEREKLLDLARNPSSYFVSVQNSEFPNGALQGQLTR